MSTYFPEGSRLYDLFPEASESKPKRRTARVPQYGSQIEQIASQGAQLAHQRTSNMSSLIRSMLKAQRIRTRGKSIGSPIRGRDLPGGPGGPKGPPPGMNAAPFRKEFRDPLKNYDVTSGYGWRINPVSGERSFHTGIDLAAPQGTPVRAVASGIVRMKNIDDIYGKQIRIGHGGGWKTEYDHLARMIVRQGQRVRRGQIIGYVGSTGWSTGAHLHLGVYRRGKTTNPRRFL